MEFPAELRGEVERLLSEENTDKLAKAESGWSAPGGTYWRIPQ